MNDKNKEIERLNENNQAYQKELCKVWDERDNAYRIINELEKYIDEDDWTSVNGEIAVRLIKLKLQELKGADNK